MATNLVRKHFKKIPKCAYCGAECDLMDVVPLGRTKRRILWACPNELIQGRDLFNQPVKHSQTETVEDLQ